MSSPTMTWVIYDMRMLYQLTIVSDPIDVESTVDGVLCLCLMMATISTLTMKNHLSDQTEVG